MNGRLKQLLIKTEKSQSVDRRYTFYNYFNFYGIFQVKNRTDGMPKKCLAVQTKETVFLNFNNNKYFF